MRKKKVFSRNECVIHTVYDIVLTCALNCCVAIRYVGLCSVWLCLGRISQTGFFCGAWTQDGWQMGHKTKCGSTAVFLRGGAVCFFRPMRRREL